MLYAILSSGEVLSSWTHPDCRKGRKGLLERAVGKVGGGSLLVRKTQCDQWWLYHFSQDEYVFILAAATPDVPPPPPSANYA